MTKNTNPDLTLALVLTVLTLFFQGTPSAALEPKKSPDVVYFHVASACSSEKLNGVTISVISHDGEQVDVGKSTEGGLAVIERARLEGARMILFCADDYFCAAIKNPRTPAGTETLVLLAPFAMT